MSVEKGVFKEIAAGGFSRLDGTVQFFFRVNALLNEDMTVVDLGAGRGAIADLSAKAVRDIGTLKGKVREVIGVDIDPAVKTNPVVDRALVYDGAHIPLADASVDLIVSDYTLEHVANPKEFAGEVGRILKPGGWLCARTPYLVSAVVAASNLVPNRWHRKALKSIQPGRRPADVFPTVYKLNTFRQLERYFPAEVWENASYTWSPEPSYHFNNGLIFWAFLALDAIKRPLLGGEVLLVFLRKKGQDKSELPSRH
jgi:ubiquinone/menaquinone biosynthesis C-methylase UbiE